ncbi:MAG: hypothetical protein LBG12_14310 [Synergistaceae bacterium]|nr:hypothetical protein [Synergistaceae bacterium]
MTPPKKIKGKTAIMTLRTDAKQLSVASAIAALRKETISEVLRKAIDSYVDEYKSVLGAALEELERPDAEATHTKHGQCPQS